jgi:glycosyltransferase involved in cell wall biosynthesis
MRVAFIARNDGTDVRQTKICNSLYQLGHEVAYVGWDRTPGAPKALNLDPRVRRFVFERKAGFGEMSLGGWPKFFGFVAHALHSFRPEVVHARDEQIAAFVLPLKGSHYRSLVLDIFDSLAARRFANPLLGAAAACTRELAHIGSDRIIETSDQLRAMLGRHAGKAIVVLNVPHDPGDALAAELPSGEALQVCVGGGLTRVRDGLEVLLKAVDSLPPGAVQIQASGWFHDDYSREVFARHPAVRYQWFDSPEEFRRQAAHSDVLTYLRGDASNTLYRSWVLPNRVFDAMSVGRPIIVSRELRIAGWVEREGLGYAYTPGDHRGLAELFCRLRERRAELPQHAARVRRLFTSGYTWPVMERRLAELYGGLA